MAVDSQDLIAQITGNFGKWQLKSILIIFLVKIPTSWFMAVIIYTSPAPKIGDYWCKPPDKLRIENPKEWIKVSHPIKAVEKGAKEFHLDFCNIYKDVIDDHEKYFQYKNLTSSENVNSIGLWTNRTDIIPCENFDYNLNFHTLAAEFNLICSRQLLVTFSQCMHILGLLLGGIIAYFLLKSYSPRRVMLIGMFSQIVSGILCGYVNHFELHVLFRHIAAVSCAFMYTAGSTIIGDITNGRPRTMSLVLYELFWSVALIVLPALSIFIDNWTHLYIIISTPTIAIALLHRLIPDSPRWMLQHGNLDKLKDILCRAAKANKRTVPLDIDEKLLLELTKIRTAKQPEITWLGMWKGSPGKIKLLAVHYAWAVYIIIFNALVLNVTSYGPKYLHMNVVIMGFSEIFGVFFGLYLILYMKRKWLWNGLICIVSGLVAYLTWTIPAYMNETHKIALIMMACIFLKITTSSSMVILIGCTATLVPVEKRKMLMFSVMTWARAWFFWAPFFGATKTFGMLIPLTILATLSIMGGCLFTIISYDKKKSSMPQIGIVKENSYTHPSSKYDKETLTELIQ